MKRKNILKYIRAAFVFVTKQVCHLSYAYDGQTSENRTQNIILKERNNEYDNA
jgi:hypothetical protein